MATEVLLHVYDVTNSMNVRANNVIVQLNKIMRDGIGLGGIFHGAIQVFDEEWSFGYCEDGSGVFRCLPKQNPMYTYRETVPLGRTTLSQEKVRQILLDMRREWQGCTYDLLARNCNHFCEEFCERLGVEKLPLWVNRFAKTGDVAVDIAGNTIEKLKQAKDEVVSRSRIAYRFIFGERPAATLENQAAEVSDSLGGSNSSRRFTYSRTPSRHIVPDSPGVETVDSESTSKVDQDRSSKIFSLFRRDSPKLDNEKSPSTPSARYPSREQSFVRVDESTSQSPGPSLNGVMRNYAASSEVPKVEPSSSSFRANALAEPEVSKEHSMERGIARDQELHAQPGAVTAEELNSENSLELNVPLEGPDYELSAHVTGDPEFKHSIPNNEANEKSPTVRS